MDTITNDNIREKAKFFKDSSRDVHIALVNSKFHNGTIFKIKESSLILIDEKLGHILINFNEIYDIEPRIPKEDLKHD